MNWIARPLEGELRAEMAARLKIPMPSYRGVMQKHRRIFKGIWIAAPALALLVAATDWLTAGEKSIPFALGLGVGVAALVAALTWSVAAGLAFEEYRKQKEIAGEWAVLESVDELSGRVLRAEIHTLAPVPFEKERLRALVLELESGKLAVIMGEPCESLLAAGEPKSAVRIRRAPPLPFSYLLDFRGDSVPVVTVNGTPGADDVMPMENCFLVFDGRLESWAVDFEKAPNYGESGWVV